MFGRPSSQWRVIFESEPNGVLYRVKVDGHKIPQTPSEFQAETSGKSVENFTISGTI